VTFYDFQSTYVFSQLFLFCWYMTSAVLLHLAFVFPEERQILPAPAPAVSVLSPALGLWGFIDSQVLFSQLLFSPPYRLADNPSVCGAIGVLPCSSCWPALYTRPGAPLALWPVAPAPSALALRSASSSCGWRDGVTVPCQSSIGLLAPHPLPAPLHHLCRFAYSCSTSGRSPAVP
jgi:hypothetical protein